MIANVTTSILKQQKVLKYEYLYDFSRYYKNGNDLVN